MKAASQWTQSLGAMTAGEVYEGYFDSFPILDASRVNTGYFKGHSIAAGMTPVLRAHSLGSVTAGTVYKGFLPKPPILNEDNDGLGSFGDTSIVEDTVFVTEVESPGEISANGDYFIDYRTGEYRVKAGATTTETVGYYSATIGSKSLSFAGGVFLNEVASADLVVANGDYWIGYDIGQYKVKAGASATPVASWYAHEENAKMEFLAVISQASTDPPAVDTELKDTLRDNFTFAYESAGVYSADLSTIINDDEIVIPDIQRPATGTTAEISYDPDTKTLAITSEDDGTPANDIITSLWIRLEVHRV